MPRSYPNYVDCAPPGESYYFFDNITQPILAGFIYALWAGGIGAAISYMITQTVAAGCVAAPALMGVLIAGVMEYENWYRSRRLMCIGADRCIVGTMADDPAVARDGDRKLDMILAPFVFRDQVSADPTLLSTVNCKDYFVAEIAQHPELFGLGPIDLTDTSQLISCVDGLPEETRILLYMRVARERMYPDSHPERQFQRHFQLRDRNEMGDEAFENSPDDSFGTASPNPLFKMNYRPPLAPFLHCELEGNRWEKIIENVLVGLWTALASFLAVCAVCLAYGVPEPACSLLGGLAALLLALLAWWLANQVNDPDEGVADQSDLDFEDPAYDGDQMTILPGDSLLIFGDWIMDEDHGNYFELHPIKAVYLICGGTGMGDNPWDLVDDLSNKYPRDRCPYPMDLVTAAERDAMCRLLDDAEKGDPPIERQMSNRKALSTVAGYR